MQPANQALDTVQRKLELTAKGIFSCAVNVLKVITITFNHFVCYLNLLHYIKLSLANRFFLERINKILKFFPHDYLVVFLVWVYFYNFSISFTKYILKNT